MYNDVNEFLNKVQIETQSEPQLLANHVMVNRFNHMQEELNEFQYANNMSDLHGCVDALIDLVYVALGTSKMMGLSEEQWTECFNRVHDANMQKTYGKVEGHKFGVKKPDDWKAPNFNGVLPTDDEYPIDEEL